MRKILYIYIIGIAALLVGCAQEEMQPGGKGWLSLESLSVNGEDLLRAEATRGIDEGLIVDIFDAEGTLLNQYTSTNAEELRRIELEAGTYTLEAYSENHNTTYTNTELGEAKYYKKVDFTIVEGQMTSVRVAVPMTNYAISLELPEGFATHMTTYGLTLTSGERAVTIQEGGVAYFDVNDAGFKYQLSVKNTDEESFATGVITYKPVESGKHYKVKYSYNTKDNQGGLDVEVDDNMKDDDVEPPLNESTEK